MRYIIFGAGIQGFRSATRLSERGEEVICFLDNSPSKQGTFAGSDKIPVEPPAEILPTGKYYGSYDKIIIPTHFSEIRMQLLDMGVAEQNIVGEISFETVHRIQWLRDYAAILGEHIDKRLCAAELGVFRGEFAKQINECFPNNKLYLFDTFEGFLNVDIEAEREKSVAAYTAYDGTDPELVMSKMSNRESVVIKKGWFPQTSVGIDEQFFFVNLDADLYQPTLEGLRFFLPKMILSGIILCHDYFGQDYPNVKIAVSDFENEIGQKLIKIPLGDKLSIAIIKV
jgi:hypothetical protein